MTKKQTFLLEHNRLSPVNLQATTYLLSRFKTEKPSLFKNDDWSIDKLRRPYIIWFTSLSTLEKEDISEHIKADGARLKRLSLAAKT